MWSPAKLITLIKAMNQPDPRAATEVPYRPDPPRHDVRWG